MTTTDIDVVILTWNDGELLGRAISAALASEGVAVRVTVIDNGSDPAARVEPDDRIALMRNAVNRGTSVGRNQGIGQGAAPLVCFVDSDARLEADTLRRLAEPLATDGSIVASAPVFRGQSPEESAGRAPTLAVKVGRLLGRRADYASLVRDASAPWWDVDFAISACLLVRRGALEAASGFDESYFYAPEDVDLCLRLREAGWRIVQVRDALCVHPPRRRNRGILTRRGLDHAWSVARHLWRHRRFQRRVRSSPR